MDSDRISSYVGDLWDRSVVPALTEYIRIPNKSPLFDAGWAEAGHMDRAVALVQGWCREHAPKGTAVEVVRLPGRAPLILLEVPASGDGDPADTVMLYGHLDKQPEMTGWDEGLGPWTPVLRGDRLYGRGGADDGYAAFASVGALGALADQGVPHARCVVLIEAGEESGSPDLPAYMDHLADRIGTPSLVVCLDSGCGNYDQLWLTTSLRGVLIAALSVEILTEGVHSGDAGGVVPSSFRIARRLLDRLEDADTGRILLDGLHAEIPETTRAQAAQAAAAVGDEVYDRFPWVPGAGAGHADAARAILDRTWRPSLAVTGAGGLPAMGNAGNVLRPRTDLKLSMRLPPTVEAHAAFELVRSTLLADPPYGARVRVEGEAAAGWAAPELPPWLDAAVQDASRTYFGQPAVGMGEGGSIPFMAMLGERFPEARFVITGVLGPGSNAHGPNEFLHIPMGKRLTACVASILAAHRRR